MFSTSPSAFGALGVPNFDHFSKRVVIPHCYFNLDFSDTYDVGQPFMFICPLHICFSEVSVMVFGPFFSWVVYIFFVGFKFFVYLG